MIGQTLSHFKITAPDGERFVLLHAEGEAAGRKEVRVVLNWFDELESIFGGTSN